MKEIPLDTPDISRELKYAIKALKSRPVLLQSILSDIQKSRKQFLMKSFEKATSEGGKDGFPKPLDLHAHDSLRYVGDMLAWIHQATASERELLLSLFDQSKMGKKIFFFFHINIK
jgi:hypothetical protein